MQLKMWAFFEDNTYELVTWNYQEETMKEITGRRSSLLKSS